MCILGFVVVLRLRFPMIYLQLYKQGIAGMGANKEKYLSVLVGHT